MVAQARLSMRKIRDILRLKYEAHFSNRQIAASIGSSRSTVQECLRRCREADITWPVPETLDESALIAKLYRRAAPARRVGIEPDFAAVHRELARRSVTRDLLWREYQGAQPQGVQYTAFCNQYRLTCRLDGIAKSAAFQRGRPSTFTLLIEPAASGH